MINQPEQFVQLALDTCDNHKFGVIKTQTAKLIEALVDNIDGAVSTFVNFISQAIDFVMGYEVLLRESEEESKESIYFERQALEC